MEKKEILDHTVVQGVFVGLARSGKDSLMKRLLGKRLSSVSLSTGVAESTIQVKVMQKSKTTAAKIEGSCWTEMDYDDEAVKLMSISIDSDQYSNQLKRYPIQYQEETVTEASVTAPDVHSQNTGAGNNISGVRPYSTSNASVNQAANVHQELTSSLSLEIIHHHILPVPNPLDILKKALRSKGLEALKQHFQKTWSLYLTNTGGQMEFQEVLPLLVSGPSMFFFTFRLDRDLNEHYSVEYEHAKGEMPYQYTASCTTIEGILHTLASISAMGTFVYQGLQRKQAPLRPKVFFIGTHKDKLNSDLAEAIIASVDRQLQDIIISTTHYKSIVEFSSPSQLIFTVNNLSESDDDFQCIRSAVERIMARGEFQMTSPAHWLIFSLALRKIKSQVISYDHCYKIARQCGIENKEELNEALYFIHSKMGLIRYFPYEDLRDTVIVDPQFLFDKVTELIVDTFTFEKVGKSKMDEFKHKGIFSIEEFEQKTHSKVGSLQFGKLLVHLRIAAPFYDRVDKRKKLFLPCVLAHANKATDAELPSTSVPSLLIAFEGGYCPKGVPGALITYFMTSKMESSTHWVLQTDEIFRDQISFTVGPYDTIVINIFPTHFEINCIPDSKFENERVHSPIGKTCNEIVRAINTGIPLILKDLNYIDSHHKLTFQCQAHTCKRNHPAEVLTDDSGCPRVLQCKNTKDRFKLPAKSYYWGFPQESETATGNLQTLFTDKLLDPALPVLSKEEVYKHCTSSEFAVPALVLTFPGGSPQKGLFSSLLYWLVSHTNSHWSIRLSETKSPACLFSNCIQLDHFNLPVILTLVDTYTHFQAHVSINVSTKEELDELCPTVFAEIHRVMFDGIHNATINLNCPISKPNTGLLCPCGKGDTHAATVNLTSKFWKCSVTGKGGKLTPLQLLWFPTADMQCLTECHLSVLINVLKSHAGKWMEIGVHLGFRQGDLQKFAANPLLLANAPLSFLQAMLSEWLQRAPRDNRGSPSLDSLKSALNKCDLGATASDLAAQLRFLKL